MTVIFFFILVEQKILSKTLQLRKNDKQFSLLKSVAFPVCCRERESAVVERASPHPAGNCDGEVAFAIKGGAPLRYLTLHFESSERKHHAAKQAKW